MRVRMGWSGETDPNIWQKVDIELEQEDLLRLLREKELPADLHERLPTQVCFQLLQNEAEMLLLNKLRQYGYPEQKAADRSAVLAGGSNFIIESIKNQLTAA